MIVKFRILLLLLTASYLLVACEDDSTGVGNIESYIVSAQTFLEQGQFRAALIEVRNVFQIDPANETATIIVANISLQLGDPKRAYRRLETIKGTSQIYFESLVEAYIQSRKYNSALAILLQQKRIFASNPITQKLLTGRAYSGLRQFEEAEILFEAVLTLEPDNLEAQLGQIRILALRGDFQTVEARLQEILSVEPLHLDALILISAIYQRTGRLDLAEDTLTSIIGALPVTDIYTRQRAGVVKTLITLLTKQGRSGEALVYQQILSEAFPSTQENSTNFNEALASIKAGNFEESEKMLLKLYEQFPGSEAGGTALGVLNLIQGRDEEAYRYFSKAVDPETAAPRILEAVATNLLRMNQPDKVVKTLEDRISGTRNPNLLVLYGIAAIKTNLVDEGVAALQKAINLDPDNLRIRLLLVNHYNSTSPPEYQSAYDLLQLGYEINPTSANIRLAVLDQLNLMDRRSEAAEMAKKQLEAQPEDYDANLIMGAFQSHVGEKANAMDYYRRAMAIDPSRKAAYLGMAKVSIDEHHWEQAKSAYRKIVVLDNADMPAMRGLLQAYISEGMVPAGIRELEEFSDDRYESASTVITEYYISINSFDEADRRLQKLRQRSPDSAQIERLTVAVEFKRAMIAEVSENYVEARKSIIRALEASPLNRRLLQSLARIEINSGQLLAAEKVLKDIRTQFPTDAWVHETAGDLAIAKKNYAQALEEFQVAWEFAPSDALGEKIMFAFRGLGDIDAADEFAVAWKIKIPTSVMAIVNRVELYPDNYARAISIYETQKSELQNTPGILNNLAWYYFQAGNLEKGLQNAEKAHNLVPSNASIMDTYGWLLYNAGELEKSLELLMRAAKLDPDASEIQTHLDTVKKTVQKSQII